MYLFTRSRRVDPGDVTKAMEWAGEITEQAARSRARQIDAWTAVMSPELGTVVWTLWAESIGEIEDRRRPARRPTPGYMKSVEKGADHFDGPVADGLATLVHGDPGPRRRPGEYVGVATATAANGRLKDAIAGGIEIADHASPRSPATTRCSSWATPARSAAVRGSPPRPTSTRSTPARPR